MPDQTNILPRNEYQTFLQQLPLDWGQKEIRQIGNGGAKVIERLAHDLRAAFPDMKGFSPRNLKYMRAFAQGWPEPETAMARYPVNCRNIPRPSCAPSWTWYAPAGRPPLLNCCV